MIIKPIYKTEIQTKSGHLIPVFNSGKTMESKYNPQKEAENLLSTIDENLKFFVIFGIGSGLFIKLLSEKFSDAKIICVENTEEDLNFIRKFENVQKISGNQNIILTNLNFFKKTLIENYIPSFYGNIKIIEMAGWKNENANLTGFVSQELHQALELISADFSVQAHFGKLWQHNILNNAKLLSWQDSKTEIKTNKKTAAIIAAGPTLDKKISYLKENQDSLFLIATDTAFQTLSKHQIFPEIVVSIDGQFISHEHFFYKGDKKTIFAFDLCSNNSTIKKIQKLNCPYFLFSSGHPLSNIISTNFMFPELYAGAGTVTISALDLGFYLGFTDIQIIGADFAYIDGKPYTKGTYLDSIYRIKESKIKNFETVFSKLMYRTELKEINSNIKTTNTLISYKNSFEEYLDSKKSRDFSNLTYKKENDIYFVRTCDKNTEKICKIINEKIDLHQLFLQTKENFDNQNYNFLLPFIAYLRNKNKDQSFENLCNLAYSYFVSYNNFHEKK